MFWMMGKQANQKLLNRLEANQYSDQETIVLTIPLTLPYPTYQNGFERVDGEFEYQGEHYKLVKQKLENDTLFIVCIKDFESKKIFTALADFSKLANNLPAGSKQALNYLSKLFKDFTTTDVFESSSQQPLLSTIKYFNVGFSLLSICYPIDSPPPQVIS